MLEEVKIKREMDRDMLIQVARTSLRTKVHQELADLLTEVIYKPLNEKTCLWSFLTRSDTNQAIQSQKMARSLKFRIQKVKRLYDLCTCSKKKDAEQLHGYLTTDLHLCFCICKKSG